MTSNATLTDPRYGTLVHECEDTPEGLSGTVESRRRRRRSTRIIGVDAARGIALIGMVAVHTMEAATPDGDLSLTWSLSSGTSSALFALLSGVGVAFMTGRTRPPRGAAWGRGALVLLVRGLLIGGIGLLLGSFVSSEFANVILPYLGLMFISSMLLLPLGTRALLSLGLAWAVLSPVISYFLRLPMTEPTVTNLSFGDIFADPLGSLSVLVLTGFFPALTWMSYVAIGLGLGRADLRSRSVIAGALTGGLVLALGAQAVAALLNFAGAREQLAADVSSDMSLSTFTDYLIWGGSGTLPTDSPWWLAVLAPHSGTPLDLLYTIGVAMAVLGACLALSSAFAPLLRLLAIPGSMTLTLYVAHLLLLEPMAELPDVVTLLLHLSILIGFALAWNVKFNKGPLEWVVASITRALTPARPSGGATAYRKENG